MHRQLIALALGWVVACAQDGDGVAAHAADADPRDAPEPSDGHQEPDAADFIEDDSSVDGGEAEYEASCERAADVCPGADADFDASSDAGPSGDAAIDGQALDAVQPDAAPSDSCDGLTAAGRCGAGNLVELCVPAMGEVPARREQFACAADERCSEVGGRARCVLVESCHEGVTRCRDANTLARCRDGRFVAEPCSSACAASQLGALCRPAFPLARFGGSLHYEHRPVRDDLRDFGAAVPSPGQGVLIATYRGDTLIDAVRSSDTTEDAGAFEVWLPAAPGAEDRLVVMAAATDADGRLLGAVADPGHAASTRVHTTDEAAPAPRIWSYAYAATDLQPGQALLVAAASGSGALHVFDALRRVLKETAARFHPAAPETLLAWLGLGTRWDCGSCMASDPVEHFGQRILHQLWVDGSSDEAYWSDALVMHELGHYVLAAYSYAPTEAGPHYLGVPTHPGLAFNEGFATFFSSHMRGQPLYFDKQDGVFFWFRLDTRSYAPGGPVWLRPQASRGLFQLLDENEVAALLWALRPYVSPAALLDVLAEPRLRVPPFERGYTERRWSDATRPEDYRDTRLPHVMLADYLDALRCRGDVSAEVLDQVLEPNTRFPYDSGSPRCR